jgi:hypothetical protein
LRLTDLGHPARRRGLGLLQNYSIILVVPLMRVTLGENCNMPSTVNLYQIGVWFCVGFFTGAGWASAAWLVGRILRF